MRLSSKAAMQWLYQLDSYTNTVFGRSRTLSAIHEVCVACAGPMPTSNGGGLCPRCTAQREPDATEIVLFRPLRGRKTP
jgi:predicted amidophosphoribosyltransferase